MTRGARFDMRGTLPQARGGADRKLTSPVMDRVLELGGHAAGFCGRLFAQSGYDVVRVEADGATPAWASQAAMDLYLHAGKRRVRTEDAGLIADLASRADIVVAEAGASPLEPYNGEALLERIRPHVRCTVLCASDPYAVLGVTRGFGFDPDMVAGVATSTSAGVDVMITS